MRIAVIGDIHANAAALDAALMATRKRGYDLRVLLGDLLTYGVEVKRTLDTVHEALSEGDTVLLAGNHDAIYSNLLRGRRDLIPTLPAWIRRQVDWTLPLISNAAWVALPFQESLRIERVFLAHANPFGHGHWVYLDRCDANVAAVQALKAMDADCGVFGHTHRARRFVEPLGGASAGYRPFDFEETPLERGCVHLLNAGSIGQPRTEHPREVILWLDLQGSAITHRFEPIAYDLCRHRQAVLSSNLPEDVKLQCLRYHATAFA